MMRANTRNRHVHGGYTQIDDMLSNIIHIDDSVSEHVIKHEALSQSHSANIRESEQSIVNENILQNYSEDVDKLCSMENNEQEDEHIESLKPSYFKIFECGRSMLDKLDVSYEIMCMASKEP